MYQLSDEYESLLRGLVGQSFPAILVNGVNITKVKDKIFSSGHGDVELQIAQYTWKIYFGWYESEWPIFYDYLFKWVRKIPIPEPAAAEPSLKVTAVEIYGREIPGDLRRFFQIVNDAYTDDAVLFYFDDCTRLLVAFDEMAPGIVVEKHFKNIDEYLSRPTSDYFLRRVYE